MSLSLREMYLELRETDVSKIHTSLQHCFAAELQQLDYYCESSIQYVVVLATWHHQED